MQQTPLDRTYLQSYLVQSGIRFDFNLVDTICRRKLNLSFYLALIAILLIFALPPGMMGSDIGAGEEGSLTEGWIFFYSVLLVALIAYLCFYLGRYAYYSALRAKLRRDDAPLAVEAYAVVCLDLKRNAGDYLGAFLGQMLGKGSTYFCKYAVVYKEVGTTKPRFFLTAATSAKKLCFVPEHLGLVFIHRKKAALYTLDDQSSYQTVSGKQHLLHKILMGGANANIAPRQSSAPHGNTDTCKSTNTTTTAEIPQSNSAQGKEPLNKTPQDASSS